MITEKRHRRDHIKGADILIGDASKAGPDMDGRLSNDEICEAIGCNRSNISVIAREATMRLQLRMVSECVGRALPTWEHDTAADVVVFVIERRLGAQLIYGDVTIDDVLDQMDDAKGKAV